MIGVSSRDDQLEADALRRASSAVSELTDSSFAAIPTEDPVAALRFCRALARSLALHAGAAGSVSDTEASCPCDLSLVIPVYNEEGNLPALYQRLTAVLQETGLSYEIIFVDDGSRDSSVPLLKGYASHDPCVMIIQLARNFGHQIALSAGLEYTRGRGVIVMDADLQDPPEVLPQFIAKWQEGHDVVYAIRQKRKEGWFKRMSYLAFYRLLRRLANIDIPLDAGDFCIMDRRVVDLLVAMPERNRFVRGIRSWVGFDQVGLAYERQARHAGESKYSLARLIYLALDGLVSFSFVPLRFITISGFSISGLSLIMALFYAIKRLVVGLNPAGFASLMVSIFFFSGIQLITIGVIGEYIGRIFEEVKRRPLYVVRDVVQCKANHADLDA